jgi:hypothetical protein
MIADTAPGRHFRAYFAMAGGMTLSASFDSRMSKIPLLWLHDAISNLD